MGTKNKRKNAFNSKRCPECATELPLDFTRCTNCGKRVGKVDRTGRAIKPIDWFSYVKAILSLLVFALFIWWAFLKE